MGGYRTNDEITTPVATLIILLSVLGHTNFILKELGIGILGGIFLFITNPAYISFVTRALEKAGGIRHNIHGNKAASYDNDKLVFTVYRSNLKDDQVNAFFDMDSGINVMITSGTLADKPTNDRDIIFADLESLPGCQALYGNNIIFDFIKKVNRHIENDPDAFVTLVDGFTTVMAQRDETTVSDVKMAMLSLHHYLLSSGFLTDISKPDGITRNIDAFCKIAENEDIGLFDDLSLLRSYFIEFIAGGVQEVKICSIDNITGDSITLLDSGYCVVFDTEYYYISDILFSDVYHTYFPDGHINICKRRLYDEKFIHHAEPNSSYSIKKTFYTSYGKKIRKRVLYFHRSFFDRPGEITLAERT